MQSNSAMESERVVVVIDAGIHAAGDAGHEVKPLGCVKRKQRAGVVERDPEIKNVSVRVKGVSPRIDRFRSFQGHELPEFQIQAAFREHRKVQAQVRFRNVRLIGAASRPVIAHPERMDETRVRAEEELQFESPIETKLRIEHAFPGDHRLVQYELVAPVVKKPAELLIVLRSVGVAGKAGLDPAVNGQARLGFFFFDELLLGVFLRRGEGLRIHLAGRERNKNAGENRGELAHQEQSNSATRANQSGWMGRTTATSTST